MSDLKILSHFVVLLRLYVVLALISVTMRIHQVEVRSSQVDLAAATLECLEQDFNEDTHSLISGTTKGRTTNLY